MINVIQLNSLRIFLFLLTNIAVLVTLGIVANILCALLGTTVEQLVGPEYASLLIFAFVYGFIGAFISLLLSKPMAKFACRAQTIDGSEGEAERIREELKRLADSI